MIRKQIFKEIFDILTGGMVVRILGQISKKDIEQLKYGKEQGHLFSRKFDLEKYPEMKERILELIYEDKFK